MNAQGSGWGGGSRTGGSVALPKKPRPFKYFPEKHEVKSPFPPLEEAEKTKVLTQRTRRPGSSLPREDRQRVVDLKNSGLSIAKIEAELGLTNGQVRGALRAEGIVSPPRSKLSASQKATIRETYGAGGTTMADLAARYSVSATTIATVVKNR